MRKNQGGFTLIEILMVVMLVAIMAVVAIPQYLDFQSRAKDEATKGVLGAMKTAIQNQKAQRIVKCDAAADTWPEYNTVANNYIAHATPATACSTNGVGLSTGDLSFVPGDITAAAIPANPWNGLKTIKNCNGDTNCDADGDRSTCDGVAVAASTDGWCYDATSGTFFAFSNEHGENAFQ